MPVNEKTAADLGESLRQITVDVLETMFYLFPEEDVVEEGEGPWVGALFRFEGEVSGVVTVVVTEAAARTAAANFLAVEEEEAAPEQVAEVVCELVNMIGGSLLGSMEHESPLEPFPPEEMEARAFEGREAAARHVFPVENGTLTVSLYWE